MSHLAPFRDVNSFVVEEGAPDPPVVSDSPASPFLTLYEIDEAGGLIDPEAEEIVQFVNELYDEEFDEALSDLVDEARAIYEARIQHELEDPRIAGYQTERVLDRHFAPLVAEAEAMFEGLANQFAGRDMTTLTVDEIDGVVDAYQPSATLTPQFEDFLRRIGRGIKNVAKKTVSLAKKGVSAAAKLGLGPILNRLKPLVKPLIKRVIRTAIGRLPRQLQPMARKLAERVPFLREIEEDHEVLPAAEACEIAEIQHEFNQNIAGVLFARTEVEQELVLAQLMTEERAPDTYPLAELDRARDRLVENLRRLKEGEDPAPYIEEFVPALLPALRIGIRLAGRKRVVGFLAQLLGRLIGRFVGPKYTPALSQAIVDAGLRLLRLEVSPEESDQAAAEAAAATIEDTVQQVAAAPDYVLEDQELFEGFVLEAFEKAATANLPAVLPEATYRKRPDLIEARRHRGVWVTMPPGRRKRYKKYSRRIPVRLTPHKAVDLETIDGNTLEDFLEEELDIEPGEEVEAIVHLYEAITGTTSSHIARLEQDTPGLGTADAHDQFHPLSREAAAVLLGEPDLGRDIDPQRRLDPHTPNAGDRFYYLEIPGKRPLTATGPSGRTAARRPTQLRLILDFPKNEIRVYLFLSEVRAQEVAVKLRQHAHVGVVMTRLRHFVERGLRRAFSGAFGRLKIVHESVTPDRWAAALRRLPSLVRQVLRRRLTEWTVKGLADHLKRHGEEFIKAADDTADGVTILITLTNPPGFPQLRQALKGKTLSLASLRMSDGALARTIKIIPGHSHE